MPRPSAPQPTAARALSRTYSFVSNSASVAGEPARKFASWPLLSRHSTAVSGPHPTAAAASMAAPIGPRTLWRRGRPALPSCLALARAHALASLFGELASEACPCTHVPHHFLAYMKSGAPRRLVCDLAEPSSMETKEMPIVYPRPTRRPLAATAFARMACLAYVSKPKHGAP